MHEAPAHQERSLREMDISEDTIQFFRNLQRPRNRCSQPGRGGGRGVRNEFSRLYASRLYRGARNLGKLETTLHVVGDGVGESSVKADALSRHFVWKLLIANLRGCRNDLSQHDTFEGGNVRYVRFNSRTPVGLRLHRKRIVSSRCRRK